MPSLIIVCPNCNANYPPVWHRFLQEHGKCVFCDIPKEAFLRRRLPRKSPELLYSLPYFPFQVLDLDKYTVKLPFLEHYFQQIHATPEDQQVLRYVVKLELIRAQIKTELSQQTMPNISESKESQN